MDNVVRTFTARRVANHSVRLVSVDQLIGYAHVREAKSDIEALINIFPNLQLQDAANLVQGNEKMLSLKGTIPVKIRGIVYNIPIVIWLKPAHPHCAPIVFVTPTHEMAIAPNQFTDSNGRVYLPYLDDWKEEQSDSTTLVQILCATFSENCPVYTKPSYIPVNRPFPSSRYIPRSSGYYHTPYRDSRRPIPMKRPPPYTVRIPSIVRMPRMPRMPPPYSVGPPAALSDERAQEIIDKALEESCVEMRNIISVLTGLMGAGKTCFLRRVFNMLPPSLYTSTGITEQSFRGFFHHIGTLSSWEVFSNQKILEFLADLFHQNLPPADMMRLAKEIASLDLSDGADPLTVLSQATSTSSSATGTDAPTVNPTPATPSPTLSTKSDTRQSIMRLVKAPKGSYRPTMLELIHMIDTGGQPEYLENMPSLIHYCHLAVLVLNLLHGLDDYPSVHYHEEGKKYERTVQSHYSNRQIMQKLAATLQAKRFSLKEGQCFRLIAVVSHRDCVPEAELSTRVEAYHQALKNILLPANNDELICYSDDEIPFVLDLKNPDSTDLAKLDLIREKVGESGVGEVIKVPGAFLIFEQELAEFAEKTVGRSIVTLDECLKVGAKLKMEPDVVMSALILFHRQLTFLYFRHVLPNLIFIRPHEPLDCINAIVQFSYKVHDMKGVTKKLTTSLRDGIITEEILNHEHFSKCFIPNLYEPRHAIDLLSHSLTLAPLSHEAQSITGSSADVRTNPSPSVKKEKREYLMMSLRQAIPYKDIPQYIPASYKIAPLVVRFTKNCIPISCFSRTISCLLSMFNWRLSRAEDGSPECLAHNIVSLYKPQTPGQIILVDVGHSLQVHIKVSKDIDPHHFPDICFQVHETVFTAIEHVFEILHLSKIEISRAFICPCPREPHNHSASVYQFKSRWILNCTVVEKDVGIAEKNHIMWLDTPVTETMKPSLPKLLKLKVPQKIGTNYYQFGILLLNDDNGTLIRIIEYECREKCERIVCDILSYWLKGKGKPVTWEALIETLHICNLTELAEHIREKMC